MKIQNICFVEAFTTNSGCNTICPSSGTVSLSRLCLRSSAAILPISREFCSRYVKKLPVGCLPELGLSK